VDIDRLVAAPVGLAPHLGEQLAPGHHVGAAQGQVGQQVELEPGELERAAVEAGRAGAGLHDQAANAPVVVGLVALAAGGAAQYRPDAGLELGGRVGLDHVVVGALVE